MLIDLELVDKFFKNNTFLPKDFCEKISEQSAEVKEQFVKHFANHFSLVTAEKFAVCQKQLAGLQRKMDLLEKKIDQNS